MALQAEGIGTDPEVIDRSDGGITWLAHPEETMQRASHALVGERGAWLVDPVDADGLDDLLASFGPVAGVVVAFDRHRRDAVSIADRHGVAVYVPEGLDGTADQLREAGADVERFDDTLAESGYRAIPVRMGRFWREVALFDGETLVVPEAVGTASYFLTADERLGVHPMLRATPPRALAGIGSERVLVGHGRGIYENADAALADAIAGARRRLPRLYAGNLREFLPV